jgi:hypothetical protein
MTNTQKWGIVAEFDSARAIYQAAEKTTAQGYTRVDAHTPFPVGWLVLCGGITGICLAQLMMWWMNGVDYVMWVSGKTPYAWETTIPITFELMVLLAGITAVFGMFGLNKLPRLHHPIFSHKTFWRVTDDRFFLSIEATDPKFDSVQTVRFLESLGGKNVAVVED